MISPIRTSLNILVFVLFIWITQCTFATSKYELSLPILLNADANPFNKVLQTGQTMMWLNEISWDAYYSSYQGSGWIVNLPGISWSGAIQESTQFEYLCIGQRKDAKATQNSVYIPDITHSQDDRIFWIKKILQGWFIQRKYEKFSINTFKMSSWDEAHPSIYCATQTDRYIKDFIPEVSSEVTYRVQYPVGTQIFIPRHWKIRAKNVKIVSNYVSHLWTGSGILFVNNELDRCLSQWTCLTSAVIITSLDWVERDITESRNLWYKDHPQANEYFPIPSDTEKITFKFNKK